MPFSLISIKKELRPLAYAWEESQFTFPMLSQHYLNIAYCHNFVKRELALLQVSTMMMMMMMMIYKL